MIQFWFGLVFFYKSRKVKEINWLPKLMIFLAMVNDLGFAFGWILYSLSGVRLTSTQNVMLNTIDTITQPIMIGCLIRF